MAFGGVETGNMKAQDAARVAGIISSSGCTSIASANEAMMGNTMFAVAVFEVNSVRPDTTAATLVTTMSELAPSRAALNSVPIQSDNPVTPKPFASASPPPNNNRIPHGTFFAPSQSRRRPPVALLAGMRNKSSAMKMDTVPSLTMPAIPESSVKREDQPGTVKASPKRMLLRVIQSSATPANTMPTLRSSVETGPSFSISLRMNSLPLKGLSLGSGKITRQSKNQEMNRNTTLKGRAKAIQAAKEIPSAPG